MESYSNTLTITDKYRKILKYAVRDKLLLLLLVPAAAYFIIFHYIPMYGLIISFKDFQVGKGIMGSPWVGFEWFGEFFDSIYFLRLLKNTVLLSLFNLLWGFPIPIIFALFLNEVRNRFIKRSIQTISYLPYFISTVVIVGLMANMLSPVDGVINKFIVDTFGGKPVHFMGQSKWFRSLYISTNIWQSFGFSSIIYIAALTGIDIQLYEAARIDGASKLKQMLHISIPGIIPTITVLFILSIGNLLSVGFEKIILMYSPATYDTSDVIATYTYRRGIIGAQYSFSAAVSLFNSVINFTLLIGANWLSGRFSENSLW